VHIQATFTGVTGCVCTASVSEPDSSLSRSGSLTLAVQISFPSRWTASALARRGQACDEPPRRAILIHTILEYLEPNVERVAVVLRPVALALIAGLVVGAP